jgi:hypothetical protein
VRRALVLLAALALSGCASQLDIAGLEWGKSGVGTDQVTLDELECAREANEAGRPPDLFVGGLVDVARVIAEESIRTNAFNGCMKGKGYSKIS